MKLRALVLAAGLGTRLRPLTESVPKPLLPIAGRPVLAWTLDRLKALGCEAAAINLHHEGEQIRRCFGDRFAGMPLVYSEEESLLGTLGALVPLRGFLASADLLLVINGDSLCWWPLKGMVRRHLAADAEATLLLATRADPARYGGGVGIDRRGRVLSLFDGDEVRGEVEQRFVFAGAHVLSPALLHRHREGPGDIISDLYLPLLGEGARIRAVVSGRRWHDLGTPRRYLEGALDWGRGPWPGRLWRRRWISREAQVDGRSRLAHCVVEAGARVEGDTRLERVLLLPGCRVGRGSMIKGAILGFGAEVPAGSWVERRLITRRGAGFQPGEGVSLVGGMIYTPMGDGSAPAEAIKGRRGGGKAG